MYSEQLIEAVSETSPVGEEGVYTLPFQELTALSDYLTARLELAEVERLVKLETAKLEGSEALPQSVQATLDAERRKFELAEASVKDIIGRAATGDGARNELRNRAERMLRETSKDLRVVQHLAFAWLLEQGAAGLADGFRLADALLERYGAQMYPQPDEDDPSDVSAREMVVSEMINGESFLAAFRECVLLEASGVGRFSGRDADVIDRKLEDDKTGVRSLPEISTLAQVAGGGTPEGANAVLRQAADAIASCEQAAQAVVGRFKPGSLLGDRVTQLLQRVRGLLQSAQQGEEGTEAAVEGEPGAIGPIAVQSKPNGAAGGPLRTREDARRLILQICKFLEETEPSHPAPLFLRRAERLLGAKDFFAIVRDMSPDSIAEMERITGHRESGSDS
jgi:type VI secretion system protein ImpA